MRDVEGASAPSILFVTASALSILLAMEQQKSRLEFRR